MIPRPPRSTRTATRFPYTTLFRSLADALLAPTTIYVRPMLSLLHEFPLHAMAHITGGGLQENIIRVVPDGLGIAIDASAWPLPPLFDRSEERRVGKECVSTCRSRWSQYH